MNRTKLRLAAILGAILLAVADAPGQNVRLLQHIDSSKLKPGAVTADATKATDSSAGYINEVDLLKHRVEEVENQNRTLMRIVTELKERLDATNKPSEAKVGQVSATASTTSTPPAAQPQSDAGQPDKNQPPGWSDLISEGNKFNYYSLNPGFSTDDPMDQDLPNGGRTRNRAFYLANRITPGGNFLIGADYLRWLTNFKGLRQGLDNRINLFFQYSF